MSLIKKLQECSTIGQADPILTRLGAGPAVKKLVETAIILSSSQDPQQRSHAFSFMESAIKELEDNNDDKLEEESPMGQHSNEDGLTTPKIGGDGSHDSTLSEEENDKDDNEHKLHEEELKNNNQGERTTGSEQSTDNTQPYPGEGDDSADGEKDMQKMDGTVNQWNETGGMPPGGMPPGGMPPGGMPPGGMPPGMPVPPAMPGMMPGLDPNIAQEMGMVMPKLPPMDTNQMMQQMQYTVKNIINDYHKRVAIPNQERLSATINKQRETLIEQNNILNQQREVIKNLSQEIRETKTTSGNLKFDIDYMRKNSNASFRETDTPPIQASFDSHGMPGIQPITQKQLKLIDARSQIEQMDKILNSGNKFIYG